MWSNVISISKEYDKEIGYILDKLKDKRDLSFAIEESKDRLWIYLASVCELQDKVEKEVYSILNVVFLSFMKLRFFLSRLSGLVLNHANCALICSLVHFDREYESCQLSKTLSNTLDYNIDGIMNFRLRALRNNWEELCAVAKRLVDSSGEENDIYDIASFITGSDGAKCQIGIRHDVIKNLTYGRIVEIVGLFESEEFNMLSAIIKEHPSEIILDDCDFSPSMSNTLRHLARIIEK